MEGNGRHVSSMTPELVVVGGPIQFYFPRHCALLTLSARVLAPRLPNLLPRRGREGPLSLLLSVFLSLSFCAQRLKQFEGHLARDSASPRDERRNSSEGRLTAWHWRQQRDCEASQKLLCWDEIYLERSIQASLGCKHARGDGEASILDFTHRRSSLPTDSFSPRSRFFPRSLDFYYDRKRLGLGRRTRVGSAPMMELGPPRPLPLSVFCPSDREGFRSNPGCWHGSGPSSYEDGGGRGGESGRSMEEARLMYDRSRERAGRVSEIDTINEFTIRRVPALVPRIVAARPTTMIP